VLPDGQSEFFAAFNVKDLELFSELIKKGKSDLDAQISRNSIKVKLMRWNVMELACPSLAQASACAYLSSSFRLIFISNSCLKTSLHRHTSIVQLYSISTLLHLFLTYQTHFPRHPSHTLSTR
jgi:hypothetical protein